MQHSSAHAHLDAVLYEAGPDSTKLLLRRRVQNLFHSVSLNVNNPHFLIMQGRITKVRRPSLPAPPSTQPMRTNSTGMHACVLTGLRGFSQGLSIRRMYYVEADVEPVLACCVTQVLNMKPPEILGMLEEAAGTRMYETKKEAALRTLDKKQVKVAEIEKARCLFRLAAFFPFGLLLAAGHGPVKQGCLHKGGSGSVRLLLSLGEEARHGLKCAARMHAKS